MYKIINIKELNFRACHHYLNEKDKQKIYKYVNKVDQLRSLGSIILQKEYISSFYNNLSFEDIHICYTDNGKPYYEDLKYNISHDDDIVIIVYSNNLDDDIGVDVMKCKNVDIDKFLNCFTSFEKMYLSNETFFKYWCAKEAFLKAIGKGLLIDLNLVEFNIINNTIKYENNIYYVEFIKIPEYICAYVVIDKLSG